MVSLYKACASLLPGLPVSGPVNGPVQSNFSWTPTAAQLGSYVTTYVAEDPQGVQTPTTVNVTVACNIDLSSSHINVTCNNLGSITMTTTTGVGPFQFSINGGTSYTAPQSSNTFTFTNLAAGTYNLKIKDIKSLNPFNFKDNFVLFKRSFCFYYKQ